jgi:uncharacterized protein YnzC (UPF0291/DUF896 family)
LNELMEKDYIRGSIKAKSTYLTKEGIKEAEKLVEKYLHNINNQLFQLLS